MLHSQRTADNSKFDHSVRLPAPVKDRTCSFEIFLPLWSLGAPLHTNSRTLKLYERDAAIARHREGFPHERDRQENDDSGAASLQLFASEMTM
jgi:hypothetical protein